MESGENSNYMKDLISRTATLINMGADNQTIYYILTKEGLDSYQAFLTYQAGKIIAQDRETSVKTRIPMNYTPPFRE